jgi:hypothetical protein
MEKVNFTTLIYRCCLSFNLQPQTKCWMPTNFPDRTCNPPPPHGFVSCFGQFFVDVALGPTCQAATSAHSSPLLLRQAGKTRRRRKLGRARRRAAGSLTHTARKDKEEATSLPSATRTPRGEDKEEATGLPVGTSPRVKKQATTREEEEKEQQGLRISHQGAASSGGEERAGRCAKERERRGHDSRPTRPRKQRS